MSRRQPRRVADAVALALERAAPQTLLAAVQSVWPAAVGAAIAAEASPVAERDGLITVACRSATWAQELELMGDELTKKIGSELPQNTPFAGLRFTATGDPSTT
jgi:predicted nucleic acid-binding Zn ribbon protein